MKLRYSILFIILCVMLFPTLGRCEELTVFADAWNSEMNPAFERAYPEVTVRNSLDEATHVSFDQMLVGLLAGESDYDMFYLRCSNGRAKTLSDRGYLADLGQSELIRQVVSQMPESIQQHIITADGRIFAFPCVLEPEDHLMGFNTEVAEQLGIRKPETYAEFFDLLARWNGDYEAQAENAGLYLVYDMMDWTPWKFLSRMINAYIAGYPDVSAISYDTPEFKTLMQLYDQHREMLSGLRDNTRVQSSGQPWKHALIVTDFPLLMDFDTEESYGGVIAPMPLSITDQPADAVIPMDMGAYSINADTPRLELAIRYLECRAAAFSPAERILFQGGSDDTPVEQPNYAGAIAYYQMMIPALEARIEAEGEAEELLAELEQYRLERQDCIDHRYAYTAESIRMYASLAGYLRPMPSLSCDYYASQPNTKYLLDSFEQGEISIDKFIRDFDHVQRMMNLEAQY